MTLDDLLALNLDQLTEYFLAVRSMIADKNAEAATAIKPFNERLELVRGALHKKLNDLGVKSVKTASGTPYLSTTASVKMENWDAFHAFVEETQEPDFLIKNANQTKVQDWMDKYDGQLPPGVSISYFQKLNVKS